MSTPDSHPPAPPWYEDAWKTSASQVLEAAGGEPFAAEPLAAEETRSAIDKLAGEGTWARFSMGGPLAGELAWLVSTADGLRLAQILKTEPLDNKAAFDESHKEAFAELLRQMAGAAATALTAKLGPEVKIEFAGAEAPPWTSSHDAGFRLSGKRIGPLSFYARFSPELVAALASCPASARPESAKEASYRPPPGSGNGAPKTNVDLLREVELGVTLRFGERQVLLRDLLELVPGAVIELDQQVDDPVELLVGKKVIARGEVVVVDGNYGLRVTEIVSPAERIESLRT